MFYRKKVRFFRGILVFALLFALVFDSIPVFGAGAAGPQAAAARGTMQEFRAGERTTDFNEDWCFRLEAEGTPEAQDYDDSSWTQVDLPYDWSIEQDFDSKIPSSIGSLKGGTGWFRKHFFVAREEAGKRISIDFDGVYQDSYIWVNGRLVGNYPNGYVPFSFDITDYLVCDGETENVVAVRVTNITDNNQTTSRWYSGSGIYRDVHLTVTEPVHVMRNGVLIRTPKLEEEYGSGTVATDIVTTVENESGSQAEISVRSTIYEYDTGKIFAGARPETSSVQTVEPGKSVDVSQRITAGQPRLWSVDSPHLYLLKTEVLADGAVVDSCETRYGFNWLKFDADHGFSMNGESMKLQGVCLHHDQGALGAVANPAAIKRQLMIMQEMGVNAVRTAHNAAAPDLIRLCDELGIMVFEESFDSWWDGKNANDYGNQFFEKECTYPGVEEGTTWAKFDLQQIVKKDRNCPSIILWGIGNECVETNSKEAIDFVEEITGWVRELDTKRSAAMGENKYKVTWGVPENIDQVCRKLDVVGLNYGEMYYDSLHEKFPDWKIFGSETASALRSRGYYASPWINGNHVVDNVAGNQAEDAVSGRQLSSYDNRSTRWGRNATESLIFDRDREYVAGQFVWTGFDYIGEPEPFYGRAKSSYFGIVDTAGFPKDDYYLYQSQWLDGKEKPMVHLLPHWNWEDDAMREKVTYPEKSELSELDPGEINPYSDEDVGKIPMRVYSNAPAVELFVDGKSQGKKEFAQKTTNYGRVYQQQSEDSDRLYLEWPLAWDYKAGTKIEAVAYDESGAEIARDQVVTAGTAARLNARADREKIEADGEDLAYITVDVQDEEGNFAPNADDDITFHIKGDGEIVGVDNGDPVSRERYKDTDGQWERSAFNGKALVIVRSTKSAGSFTVTARADGLESDSVTVVTAVSPQTTLEPVPEPAPEIKSSPAPANTATPGGTAAPGTQPAATPKEDEKGEQTLTQGKVVYRLNQKKKTAEAVGVKKKTASQVKVPATLKRKGTTYKVVKIANRAFEGCTKLKTVTVGKYVQEIGKKAWNKCKKLRKIALKTSMLKKAEKKAFGTISKKVAVEMPAKKAAKYQKLFKRAGYSIKGKDKKKKKTLLYLR